ncbi:MAG: RDD family protein [Phycisphaerae bacterium]|nr:RDD family protein [Phycisphaerae bacterium]
MVFDIDVIETPENVQLERDLAGIGTRFVACLLDLLLIFAVMLIMLIVLLIAGWGAFIESMFTEGALMIAVFIVIQFLLFWGYFVFFELWTNGQTPGKKSQKLRVVKDGGGGVGFTEVAIRNLLRVIDAPAGIFCMFFTKKWQRLGDLAAGTVVISEIVCDYSASHDKRNKGQVWDVQAPPEALQATNLKPEEYQVLMNYWKRRYQLTLAARGRLLRTLVRPILERNGIHSLDYDTKAIERQLATIIEAANQASAPPSPPRGPIGGAP